MNVLRTCGLERQVMKKDLMDILACPQCKGKLKLTPDVEADDDVIEGNLTCVHCSIVYPIVGSVPNFVLEDPISESSY